MNAALVAFLLLFNPPVAPQGTPPPARVTVAARSLGRKIPRDFVGFSLEVSTGGQGIGAYGGPGAARSARSEQYALGHPGSPDRGFFRLLRDLGPGILRLGGNSQDNTCWDPARAPHPAWCQAPLTAADLGLFGAAARATGWRLIVGLNLKQDAPAWAAAEVRDGVARAIPRRSVLALEIGNEPDLYRRGARSAGYSPADQVREFAGYLRALRADRATRGYAAAGPATCCGWRNPRDLATFLDGIGPRHLRLVTIHNYARTVCGHRQVTIAELLDAGAAARFARRAAALVAVARSRGVPIAMAETNSASCGGMPGVSDSFASAVWGLDYMFALARLGFSGVNFHMSYRPGGGSSYNPIRVFGRRTAAGWNYENVAEPLYYAMYLFARHAAGAYLVPATVAGTDAVHAYAVRDCRGCPPRVFLVNEGAEAASVQVGGVPARGARVLLLSAPRLVAGAEAVRLGGARFDTQGRLNRAPRWRAVAPGSGGDYALSIPPATIALLAARR